MEISPTSCALTASRTAMARAAYSADTISVSARVPRRDAGGFLDQAAAFVGTLIPLDIQWSSRTLRSVPAESSWPITAPLVQAGEISPWAQLGAELHRRVAGRPQHRRADRRATRSGGASSTAEPAAAPTASRAAARARATPRALIAAGAPGADLTQLMRDSELIDLITGAPPTLTWKRQLDLPVPGDASNRTIRQYLESLDRIRRTERCGTGRLPRQPGLSAGVGHRGAGVPGGGHHRSLGAPARRLGDFVCDQAIGVDAHGWSEGVYVGGYGWVENLRMAPAPTPVPAAQLPAGEQAPLVFPANDSGFIHAPSATHATAAALLRNAHLGATGVPAADGPFAIDLSSRRVREAEHLLDGVRQGQPLGALLGYRFERSLHEVSLDRFIARFRTVAPLVPTAVDTNTAAADAIAANNVVDGLALNQQWLAAPDAVIAKVGATAADMTSLQPILASLNDAVDAVSDALTAEAAYQIARGNTSRIASTLAAIAQGDAPPPELEVAHVPRSGTALTHRLLVLLSPAASSGNGWVQASSSAPAAAEPALNAWIATLLGDSRKIRCTIERLDDATGAVAETRTLPLFELLLSPLELVYGIDVNASPSQGPSLTQIEQRVLYHAKHKAGGFAVNATLRLQHARPTNLAAGELTLFDALEQAAAIRKLLASARGADAEDFNPPERAGQARSTRPIWKRGSCVPRTG